MNKFEILSVALEYVEENLTTGITPEMCAEKCSYSLSNLQKMFSCAFHIGLSDYISRRKLTLAARDLLETNQSVLDIALKYGYNSHEVFTRAFMRLWGVTPSKYRKNRKFSEIFPKLSESTNVCDEKGKVIIMSKRTFDVSHLYDFIKSRSGKYVVCFDMVHLMWINDNLGSAAGDIAIAECLRRIDEEADENMLPIRIGGDEFLLITDCDNEADAKAAADKILAHNGETVKYGDNEFEVSMRAGFVVIPNGNLKYNELFNACVIAGRCKDE
ncbi:MAG: helix-turn-helix domain-containing protein [Oscillospiraceae bacterium]|nr:helix-turn-helix domain-containing protein [Oscillospiraceae bacterium]